MNYSGISSCLIFASSSLCRWTDVDIGTVCILIAQVYIHYHISYANEVKCNRYNVLSSSDLRCFIIWFYAT
jgi:hypothetical protein